jgi:hypothetical protein
MPFVDRAPTILEFYLFAVVGLNCLELIIVLYRQRKNKCSQRFLNPSRKAHLRVGDSVMDSSGQAPTCCGPTLERFTSNYITEMNNG